MSARTPRYAIEYPVGADPVNQIPEHLKTFATTVETALAAVDDRHTTATGKPVTRPTLAQLNNVISPAGFAGYVTNDTAHNGYYISDGSKWHKYEPVRTFSTQWRMPFTAPDGTAITLIRVGNTVYATGNTHLNSLSIGYTPCSETVPAGYRPLGTGTFSAAIMTRGTFSVYIGDNGKTGAMGATNTTEYTNVLGMWTTRDSYPTTGEMA